MGIETFTDPVFEAIKSHLTTNWTSTPIQWPNEEYQADGTTAFLKIEMHGDFYAQQSIGAETQAANRWDNEGTLWLHLTCPRGTGYSSASGAAKAIANLFRGRVFLSGALEFLDATMGVSRFGDELGAWYIVPISISWRHMDA